MANNLCDQLHNVKGNAMNKTTADQNEEDLITSEISDEALESAVAPDRRAVAGYTLFLCTGLDVCPGP